MYDVKNDENGNRYAIGDSISEDEDGNEIKFSGVFTYSRHYMTEEERAEHNLSKAENGEPIPDPEAIPTERQVIGEVLQQKMDEVEEDEQLLVLLWIQAPQELTLVEKLEYSLALGQIETKRDYFQKKMEFLSEYQQKVALAQTPVIEAIEDLGGEVVGLCQNLYCLKARMRAGDIDSLANVNNVHMLNLNVATKDTDVCGREVVEGHQIYQFVDNNWDGERSATTNSDDLMIGQLESTAPEDEHVGFNDNSSSSSRIFLRYSCGSSTCTYVSNWANSEGRHATLVAGLLIGDLMDGQDSNYMLASERQARSGYAREARLISLTGAGSVELTTAFDKFALLGALYDMPVINVSTGSSGNDPICSGGTTLARSANNLFETGTLVIQSAGNDGNLISSDCTITSPASAMGVFTVGNYRFMLDNPCEAVSSGLLRTISTYSYGDEDAKGTSRGGASLLEGQYRTIVDLAAYGARYNMMSWDETYYGTSGEDNCGWGTSISAPTVAATAVDFIDWYRDTLSSYINSPGVLFSNLLIMGDRLDQNRNKMTKKFDNLLGAGRLKARRWDAAGLDSPRGWRTTSFCVDDNEVIDIEINEGNVLGSVVMRYEAIGLDSGYVPQQGKTLCSLHSASRYHANVSAFQRHFQPDGVHGTSLCRSYVEPFDSSLEESPDTYRSSRIGQ